MGAYAGHYSSWRNVVLKNVRRRMKTAGLLHNHTSETESNDIKILMTRRVLVYVAKHENAIFVTLKFGI